MASTFALVSALLACQVSLVSAATSPFTPSIVETHDVPCQGHAGGCTCAGYGLEDNSSASAVNCSNPSRPATSNNCQRECCSRVLSVPTCGSAVFLAADPEPKCATGTENDASTISSPAGTMPADGTAPPTCCKASPAATCADVTCSARRRTGTEVDKMKKKAAVATTACTSDEHCRSTCCEKDPFMCGAAEWDGSTFAYKCGVNHTQKPLSTAPTGPNAEGRCDWADTAAKTAKFENGTYISVCCTANLPQATCLATPTCPENMQAKSPMNTNKCAGATCTANECCVLKPNMTECREHCKDVQGVSTQEEWVHTTVNCVTTSTNFCASAKCDTGKVLHSGTNVGTYSRKTMMNGNTAANATINTACCITKPVEAAATVAGPPSQCAAFFVAAQAGAAAAAKGNAANGARLQEASLPILALAVLLSMKL